MPSQTATTFLVLISPLVFLIVYVRIKRKRQLAALRVKAEAEETCPPKPLELKDPPAPNAFTARFPLPERTWLRDQLSLSRFGALTTAWIVAVVIIIPMLPPFLDTGYARMDHATSLWFSLQNAFSLGYLAASTAALIAAFIVAGGVAMGANVSFLATRPITRRYLYLTRCLSALASLLVGILAAFLLFATIVLILWGPFWSHMHFVTLGFGPAPAGLFTRVLRLFLWPALVFSIACTLLNVGSNQQAAKGKGWGWMYGAIGGIVGASFHDVQKFLSHHSLTVQPNGATATLLEVVFVAVAILWLAPTLFGRREL